MYSDYLNKVSIKKQNNINQLNEQNNMDVDNQTEEQRQQIFKQYEMEETKEEKAKSMKTGEKYIIRKLISIKINIPKIDDYFQKLNSLEVKENSGPHNNFAIENFGQHVSANNIPNSNINQFGSHTNLDPMNANPFKTFQGYNDDSQIAYQSNQLLFQQQMSQPNQYMQMSNQMMNGMQNLNLNNSNMFWNGSSYQYNNNNNTGAQMPMMNNDNMAFNPYFPMPNQGFSNMNGNHQWNDMQNMMSGQQNFNSSFGRDTPITSSTSDYVHAVEERKEKPEGMRLPAHMKRTHTRSNSSKVLDSQTNKYMQNSFLFDRLGGDTSSTGPKLTKMSSENISGYVNPLGSQSTSSLPAIKNLSDFQDSVASESSVFDGNDSAYASSVDIELDSNGQPIFDNSSCNGDSNSRMEGEDGSEELSVKVRMARTGVKKKSGFWVQDRNGSVSSEGSKE